MKRAMLVAGLVIAIAACAPELANLGGNDGGGGGASSGGGSGSSDDASASSSSSGGGTSITTYSGYFQSFAFPDGSDSITMKLTIEGYTVTGSVFMGNGPALPPPTDPDAGYPPNLNLETQAASLWENFAFTVVDGVLTPDAVLRIQLRVQQNELWDQWCPLLTPQPYYPADAGCGTSEIAGYGCLGLDLQGPTSTSTANGACAYDALCPEATQVAVDCGKFLLCAGQPPLLTGPVCQCTANGCTLAATQANPPLAFDMQLGQNNHALSGAVTGLGDQTLQVYMTQQ